MRGYVCVPQWYYNAKTLDDLIKDNKTGDAASIDKLFGKLQPKLLKKKVSPIIGEILFRVEDNNDLTFISAKYDSSG
jgi:hypothetical protein